MSEYIKSMGRHLTDEEARNVLAKYKVGDTVIYIDNNKVRQFGKIKEIEWTDISEWNSKSNPLYLIDGCQYLRKQSDIIELCVVATPKYRKKERVYYIDNNGVERAGIIQRIHKTDVSDWNSIVKPLYIIGSCLYLRSEKDITGFYIEETEDSIEDYIGM